MFLGLLTEFTDNMYEKLHKCYFFFFLKKNVYKNLLVKITRAQVSFK